MALSVDVLNKWSSPPDQAALDFLIERASPFMALEDTKFSGDLEEAIERHRHVHARSLMAKPLMAKMHGQDLPLRADATDLSGMIPEAVLQNLPAPIVRLMTVEERIVGIPVGVHRASSLFVNTALLQRFDIAVPRSADDLMTAVRDLARKGVRPFGLSADTMLLGLLFEDLVLALTGPEFHRDLFSGRADSRAAEEKLQDVIDTWFEIVESSLAEQRSWREAGDTTRRGETAFFACGDFASSHMLGEDAPAVVEVAFPGSADAFIFICDFFTPIGFGETAEIEALRNVVSAWTDQHATVEFCRRKGALPVSTASVPPNGRASDAKQEGYIEAAAHERLVACFTLEQATPHPAARRVLGALLSAAPGNGQAARRASLTTAILDELR